MSTSNPQLVKAYALIKAGQRTEAGNLLKTYLSTQPDDPNGWWLMAHAVTKPEVVQKCLEKVLELDPGHTRARDKLDRLQAELTPVYDFVMPEDMAAPPTSPANDRFDWGGLMAGRLGGASGSTYTSSSDILGTPARALDLPEPSTVRLRTISQRPAEKRSNTNTLIGIGMIVAAGAVLVAILAYKATQGGWIGQQEQKVPGTISTDSYSITFPANWVSECSSGFLWMQEVCAFTTDEQYSLLELYTTGRDDIGSDSLLDSVDYLFFKGGRERPAMVVTGVVLDYPQSGGDYQYIRDSILWYEELYKSWLGRTNYIQGYDLYMQYEKENPEFYGETSYIYWITGKDAIGVLMTGRGFFLICDAFIPHGDRMLMLEVVAYAATTPTDIPRQEIENMIDSIIFGSQ